MAAESRTALKSRRTLSRRVRERISVWRRLFVLNWNLFKASRIGVVGLAIMIAFVIIALAAPFMGLRDPIRWTAPDQDLIQAHDNWIKDSSIPGEELAEAPPFTQPVAFRVLPRSFDPRSDRIYAAAGNRLYAIETRADQRGLNSWGTLNYLNVSAADGVGNRTISVPPLAMNYGDYVEERADYEVYVGTSDGRVFILRDAGNFVPFGDDLLAQMNLTGAITGLAGYNGDLNAPASIQGSANYAYFNGAEWIAEALPSIADSGEFSSLALNGSEAVMAYYDYTTARPVVSRRTPAGQWVTTPSSDVEPYTLNFGQFTSLVLRPPDGFPRIAYYNQSGSALKFASWNGTGWKNVTVDETASVGQYASLALGPSDSARIAYYDATYGTLKYAWQVGTTWLNETVPGGGPDVGRYASLALSGTGDPSVAYYNATGQTLMYAVQSSGVWTNTTVAKVGDWNAPSAITPIGRYASLALNKSGNPSIAYYNATTHSLRYAVLSNGSWANESVDAVGDVGRYVSLAFDPRTDSPAIAYYDATNLSLKYAHWSGTATRWVIETPVSRGDAGLHTSLAFDVNGRPHIGYYSFSTGRTSRDVVAVGTAPGWLYVIDVGIPKLIDFEQPREKHVTRWDYRQRWSRNLGSEVHLAGFPQRGGTAVPRWSPAFNDGGTALLVGTKAGDMISLNVSNGDTRWVRWVSSPWDTAPVVVRTSEGPVGVRYTEVVYAASSFLANRSFAFLYAVHESDGRPLAEWARDFGEEHDPDRFHGAAPVSTKESGLTTDGGDLTQPTVEGTTIFVGSTKGTLYAIRRDALSNTTGDALAHPATLKWTYTDPTLIGQNPRFTGPPLVYRESSLILAAANGDGGTPSDPRDDHGVLSAVRQDIGNLSWKRTLSAPLAGSPASWTADGTALHPAVFVAFGGPTLTGVASLDGGGQYLAPSPPSWVQPYPSGNQYWLGLDNQGRDIFSQLIWGSRIALLVGFLAAFFTVVLGLVVGLVAGYAGGKTESVLMRFTDVILVLPGLPLIITLTAVLGPSIWNVILVISVLGWPGIARIIRAEVLSLKERPFIDSARVTGASTNRIVFKHIAPNVMPLAFLYMTFSVSGAILTEAALSFIGLGDQTTMSWGQMLFFVENSKALSSWWWLLPPGLAITLISLAFFLVGRAFDEIVNPRLRKR